MPLSRSFILGCGVNTINGIEANLALDLPRANYLETSLPELSFWIDHKSNREVKSITRMFTSFKEVERAYSGNINISSPGIATVSIDFSQIVKKSAYEVYYTLELVCTEHELVLKRPFKLKKEAEELLASADRPASFFTRYGDSFFDRIIYGRRALVIIQISASSAEEQQKVKLGLQGGDGHVSVGTDLSTSIKRAFSRNDATVYQYTAGLNYGATSIISTPAEIDKLIKSFDVDGKPQVPPIQIGWTTLPYQVACSDKDIQVRAVHMEEGASIARALTELVKKYQRAINVYQHALRLDAINPQLLFSLPYTETDYDFLKSYVILKALDQAFSQINIDILVNVLDIKSLREIGGRIRTLAVEFEKIRKDFPNEGKNYFIPIAHVTNDKIKPILGKIRRKNKANHREGRYADDMFSIPTLSGVELISFRAESFNKKQEKVKKTLLATVIASIEATQRAIKGLGLLTSPEKQAKVILDARMGILYTNQAEDIVRMIRKFTEDKNQEDEYKSLLTLPRTILELCELMKLSPKELSVNHQVFVFISAKLLEELLDLKIKSGKIEINFADTLSLLNTIKNLFSRQLPADAPASSNELFNSMVTKLSSLTEFFSSERFSSFMNSVETDHSDNIQELYSILKIFKENGQMFSKEAYLILVTRKTAGNSIEIFSPLEEIIKKTIEKINVLKNNPPETQQNLLTDKMLLVIKENLGFVSSQFSELKNHLSSLFDLFQRTYNIPNVFIKKNESDVHNLKGFIADMKKFEDEIKEVMVSVHDLLKHMVFDLSKILNANVELTPNYMLDLLRIAHELVSDQIKSQEQKTANNSLVNLRLKLKQRFLADSISVRFLENIVNFVRRWGGAVYFEVYERKTISKQLYLNGFEGERKDTLFAPRVLGFSDSGFYIKSNREVRNVTDNYVVEIGAQCKYHRPVDDVIPTPNEVDRVVQIIRPG